MKKLVKSAAYAVAARYGRIFKGTAKGLRFNPTGGGLRYLMGPIIPYEEEGIKTHLSTGGVFYDIGANVGYYALVGATLTGPSGHVYAFEPFPASAETIRCNARINNIKHLTVIEAGAGKESGTLSLEISDLSVTHKLGSGSGGIQVPVITVDSFVETPGNRPPNLVLIDVEGAEFDVIAGMEQTLRTHRPVVIAEIHWKGTDIFPIRDWLKGLGYRVEKLDGGELPTEPVWYHVICSPEEKVIGVAK